MTSNREWMHSAPLEEIYAWMDAEHGDAADGPNGDSDAPKSEENAENATSKCDIRDFADTRERLEADVRDHFWHNDWCRTDMVIGWLDRQAEITERECCEYEGEQHHKHIEELEAELSRSYDAQTAKAEELTLRGVRIAELQGQVDKLTAERDGWRMRCGTLLDAAHAMQVVADAWDEEV